LPTLKTSSGDLAHDEIAEALLEEAGAFTTLPTRESELLDYLGLKQRSFNFGAEPDFVQLAPDIPNKLRAALSVNDRLVVTHSALGPKRNRWSVFHEIAHFVLPEHLEKIFLDDDKTLSVWTHNGKQIAWPQNSFSKAIALRRSRWIFRSHVKRYLI